MSKYIPSDKVLDNYANVMVNFALGNGKGIKKGDTVLLIGHESAKALFIKCSGAITKSGGNVILNYLPDNTDRFGFGLESFGMANEAQLNFSPDKYFKGIVDSIDHYLYIISYADMKYLESVDSKKLIKRAQAMRTFMKYRSEKENQGKLSWTLCLYATEAMAKEAGLSLKSYWAEIINACYLDKQNPILEWKNTNKLIDKYLAKLNKLSANIDTLHIVGVNINLKIKLGSDRKWLGGRGCNIPSFEIFTSPDARYAEGFIKFNQPLYYNGNIIKDVYLEFKAGKVIKSNASQGEAVLRAMIKSKNADRVGEFSLTDKKLSRINKFMANTLYDENIGGKFGNTHIALGNSYVDTCTKDISKLKQEDFEDLGYNFSAIHTDIVSTEDRVVTATMKDGTERIIYKNGEFAI
jgi:aminopeptidase